MKSLLKQLSCEQLKVTHWVHGVFTSEQSCSVARLCGSAGEPPGISWRKTIQSWKDWVSCLVWCHVDIRTVTPALRSVRFYHTAWREIQYVSLEPLADSSNQRTLERQTYISTDWHQQIPVTPLGSKRIRWWINADKKTEDSGLDTSLHHSAFLTGKSHGNRLMDG